MTLFINSLSVCIVISFFDFFNPTCTEIYYMIYQFSSSMQSKMPRSSLAKMSIHSIENILTKFEIGLVMKGR